MRYSPGRMRNVWEFIRTLEGRKAILSPTISLGPNFRDSDSPMMLTSTLVSSLPTFRFHATVIVSSGQYSLPNGSGSVRNSYGFGPILPIA